MKKRNITSQDKLGNRGPEQKIVLNHNLPGTGLFMSIGSKPEVDKDFKIKTKGSKAFSGNTSNSLNAELYQ